MTAPTSGFLVSPEGSSETLKTQKRGIVLRRKDNGMGADDHQYPDNIGRGCDLRLGRFSERLLFFTVFPALCIDLYDLQSLRHGFL